MRDPGTEPYRGMKGDARNQKKIFLGEGLFFTMGKFFFFKSGKIYMKEPNVLKRMKNQFSDFCDI